LRRPLSVCSRYQQLIVGARRFYRMSTSDDEEFVTLNDDDVLPGSGLSVGQRCMYARPTV